MYFSQVDRFVHRFKTQKFGEILFQFKLTWIWIFSIKIFFFVYKFTKFHFFRVFNLPADIRTKGDNIE